MAGFPLMAIGAGLGNFADYWQREQQNKRLAADALMKRTLEQAQLNALLEQKKSDFAASNAAASALLGGAPDTGTATPPSVGGFPGYNATPAAPPVAPIAPVSGQPPGGGMRAGGAIPAAAGASPGRFWFNNPVTNSGFRPGAIPGLDPSAQQGALERFRQTITGGSAAQPAGMLPGTQMAQAAPSPPPAAAQVPQPSGISAPPPQFDPRNVAQLIKQQNPALSNKELVAAVELVGKQLGPTYKAQFDRWKTLADIELRQAGQAETGRHNVATETLGQGQLAETQAEHGRQYELGKGRLTEEQKRTEIAKKNAEFRQGQVTQKSTQAITQMKTLADKARQLYAAVEADPNLVGVRGYGGRLVGGIFEQAQMKKEDEAKADFKSQVNLLQAQLQKPLLGARYFSGRAQEQMQQLVPGLQRLDNPTAVKSALRNLAETLEGTAQAAEAATQGAAQDYSGMSNEDILRGLGIAPQQAPQQ